VFQTGFNDHLDLGVDFNTTQTDGSFGGTVNSQYGISSLAAFACKEE